MHTVSIKWRMMMPISGGESWKLLHFWLLLLLGVSLMISAFFRHCQVKVCRSRWRNTLIHWSISLPIQNLPFKIQNCRRCISFHLTQGDLGYLLRWSSVNNEMTIQIPSLVH